MMVMTNNKYLTLENNQLWKSNRYVDDVQKKKLSNGPAKKQAEEQ